MAKRAVGVGWPCALLLLVLGCGTPPAKNLRLPEVDTARQKTVAVVLEQGAPAFSVTSTDAMGDLGLAAGALGLGILPLLIAIPIASSIDDGKAAELKSAVGESWTLRALCRDEMVRVLKDGGWRVAQEADDADYVLSLSVHGAILWDPGRGDPGVYVPLSATLAEQSGRAIWRFVGPEVSRIERSGMSISERLAVSDSPDYGREYPGHWVLGRDVEFAEWVRDEGSLFRTDAEKFAKRIISAMVRDLSPPQPRAPLYTQTVLRVDDTDDENQIRWWNPSNKPPQGDSETIPPGAKVEVRAVGRRDILLSEGGKSRRLVAPSGVEDWLPDAPENALLKFFGPRPAAVPAGITEEDLRQGEARAGMSKNAVALVRGWPSHIDDRMVPAGNLSAAEILASDTWLYATWGARAHDLMDVMTFADGALREIAPAQRRRKKLTSLQRWLGQDQ